MALNEEYKRKIECFIEKIPKRIYKPLEEVTYEWFVTNERLTLEQASMHERTMAEAGFEWGKKWEYAWFFTKVTIPKECKGKRIEYTANLGETLVFINGKAYASLDREHTHVTLCKCAEGGEKFHIAMEVYAGHAGGNELMSDNYVILIPEEKVSEYPDDVNQRVIRNGNFGIMYDEVFQLWMDIKTLYDLRNNLDDNSLRRATIDKKLTQVCDAVNIEVDFDEFLDKVSYARKILKSVISCKNSETTPEMYAIGNSHLDLEWKWTVNETKRKVARTFGNQLRLIEEYDDYKYIHSQPWLLESLKKDYPDLYSEVRKAVADGKIIVDSGTWVEPDVNMISGESLIRQAMYAKRFLKEEFGVNSEVMWLPDSFGVSGSLPQILKGCGIKYFMNAKVPWMYNGGDPFPYTTFIWQGIDGTRMLAHIIQEYATELTPSKVFEKWDSVIEKAEIPVRILPFGHGDGGGGTTRIHTEYMKRERDLEGMPKVTPASPNEFFEYVERECSVDNKFVGEMYFPACRGCYTAQALTKKLNRRAEYALREAEMWLALLNNKNEKATTDLLWKELLFNQFHDIIPGSSIKEVHKRAEESNKGIIDEAYKVVGNSTKAVLEDKNGTITVFNSLSWERKSMIELPDGYNAIFGKDSKMIETQRFGDKTVACVDVPACGCASFILGSADEKECEATDGLILENSLIRAEFNEKGELISLFDKEKEIEFLSKPSNVFRMYQDMPTFFDAWDIDTFYEKTEVALEDDGEIAPEYTGGLIQSLIISKKINNSYIRQRVMLKKDSKCLEFETEVDWNEKHKLLKVDINTNIHTEEIISEMQYGYVKRPNHKSRPYDADRFEVCQHKWSALSEMRRGVAIINDCKYGISADDGRMSLTLLCSSASPDLTADEGKHSFTYVIMPYTENIADSDVIHKAYEYNVPLVIQDGAVLKKSLLNVSANNIIIDAVKFAEDNSGDIIVRLYESINDYTNCKLNLGFNIKEAYFTDMLEQNISKAEIADNEIQLKIRGFEVVTLRLKKQEV